MPKKKTAADYKLLAQSFGYEWLGPEVATTNLKTFWLCDKGVENFNGWVHSPQTLAKKLTGDERQSKGEKKVAQILDALDILYSRQKPFDGCKDKIALRYDFYFSFSGQQFLIEYNGEQHYKPIERWGGAKGLEDVQRRDRIKTDFAQANGLHLIIIPYTDYERIGTVIIDRVTEATEESPLTFTDRVEAARETVKHLEGIQLSFSLEIGEI